VPLAASPSSVSGAGTSALTISTTSSLAVGTYPVNVTGTSVNSHSVSLTLTVGASTGTTTVTLTPVQLVFAAQPIGQTSAAQVVQLNNTGTSPMTITGISITGTNSGDFAQNNNCGSGLASGASCQVGVTFTPAGLGARNAVLWTTDSGTGSPQMVALSGTGPDFALAPSTSQSVTVSAGQTATYTISLAPSAGFNQNVMLSCTGYPALTNCTISPNSLNGSSTTSATVTITTTAKSFVPPLGIATPMTLSYATRSLLTALIALLIPLA
jgi:hypothetical protein